MARKTDIALQVKITLYYFVDKQSLVNQLEMEMAALDIRDNQPKYTEIKFNTTDNRLIGDGMHSHKLTYRTGGRSEIYLCDYSELDDFITAIKKAKELWGK